MNDSSPGATLVLDHIHYSADHARLREKVHQMEEARQAVHQFRAHNRHDLRERLGLDVRTVDIEHVDFLRDTARLPARYSKVKSAVRAGGHR